MPDRTKEQILDEAVYAAACVYQHYGPGLSPEGLVHLRKVLAEVDWCTDTTYRVDFDEDDEYVDFHQRIISPSYWDVPGFSEVIEQSKG